MKTKDDLRALYKRSDFVKLDRGKFYEDVANGASVVPHDLELTKSSPISDPVNDSLDGAAARVLTK